MTSNDPIPAALDQLADCREQITQLDSREAGHFTALSGRLDDVTSLITGLGAAMRDQTALLARLEDLDRQVADLAAQLAAARLDGAGPNRYQPGPAIRWWTLAAEDRREPASRLRAWVEQVYRPGYGHLAAALAPCCDAARRRSPGVLTGVPHLVDS